MRGLVTLCLLWLITVGLLRVGLITTDDLRALVHGAAVVVARMTEG